MNGFLLVMLLVLNLLAHNCGTTIGASSGTFSDNYQNPDQGSGSSSVPTAEAFLPFYEVVAINNLLQSSKQSWDRTYKNVSASDCSVRSEIDCICDNNTKTCHIIHIHCYSHGLSGSIPEEIGNLASLEYLDLGENKLGGFIPKSFSKLLNLQSLYLNDNLLDGSIPPFLGNLTNLTTININNNLFRGEIPNKLGNLQSLESINLGKNSLTGEIPYQLGNLTNLETLYLYDNQLSGPLPPALGNLSALQYLALENNNLNDPLPPSFKNLRQLRYVRLRGNKFNGKVPEYIGNWTYIETLSLLGNKFEGPIPPAISTLRKLTYLEISDLIDTGEDSRGFSFPNLSQMSNLISLTLRNCHITDEIPSYILHMPSLDYIDLSFNNLAGEIPDPYLPQPPMQLATLTYIFLRRNKLSGSLPGWLIAKRDSYVDISENNFTLIKPPPANISTNLNLFECANTTSNITAKWQLNPYTCQNKTMHSNLFINCGGEKTQVNGTSYEADLEPNGGATFFLSKNGKWGYSSMGTFNNANQDMFVANRTCNMSMDDSSLYTSARLAPISLKYYGFCLKNGIYTVKLHFAEIVLNADKGLKSKARRVFDVKIQGKKVETDFNIAEEAGGVNRNTTRVYHPVHVNNSRLEIHLFWTGMGSTYEPVLYYGPLISAISATRDEKNHNRLSPLAISGIVGASLLLPLFVLLILWRGGYFGAKDPELQEIKADLQGKFFNFQQLKAATQNFSSNNKLGEGGFGTVFKGILPDGTAIAVKQFSARSMQGIREFVNEIGTISALQHPNLVKLLGCCAENSQRLLVYEYMEYNSLEHALFGSEEMKKRLDWATRVKICHGIAKGLVFLHEESELKIVHRDIKPTNILLDTDFNPKISDFGFAKLYEGEATHIVSSIAGTTGYMAPEYAIRGHLTYKADVYSFGVVLLEIVSGKNSASYLPNDQSVYLLDMACVLQKEGKLIELVDPTLENYSWDEANTILNLAMLCTGQSYTLRPTMSEVVKFLKGEKKISNYAIGDHYSMDDSAMAKVIAGLSQSTHSGSTSYAGNSALSAGDGGTS